MTIAFGKYLRELREATGLGSRQLCRIVGTGESSVCQYEKGGKKPRPETLKRIAQALDVPYEGLAWLAYTSDDFRTNELSEADKLIEKAMQKHLKERRKL